CGMRIIGSQNVSVGSVVRVFGELATVSGERVLRNAIVSATGTSTPPKPLAMSNKSLGGAAIAPNIPGTTGATGPNNVGLLVKTWGRVVEVGNNEFWIDDGSQRPAADGHVGVKVLAAGISMPSINSLVAVTGISSTESDGSLVHPVLKPRADNDIVVIAQL
ncbi:MAG: hypothetical protein QHI38_10035, partial [Armatimonadota bacterium]|nr:hypothetical protein [Armatimonadota bacterium]